MTVTAIRTTSVVPGVERLLASGRLRGRRVGLVCNPASVDRQLRHVADRFAEEEDVHLAGLFGPQHGFHSTVQDNMVETGHGRDGRRNVPVYSLYSETREPTPEMLSELDLLVIDLQDVGTRVYTFIYTMANCLRAAARHQLPVIVCDRPNPIDGVTVEGPVLDSAFKSFVGQFPIPLRHGLTIGELARLFNDTFGIAADLEVVPMEGWSRQSFFDATGLPWILPSPNMPTLDTALVYPGAVLFEGTNLSEGRGTTRPFELIGAPWIDARALADRLNARGLPGVWFRPIYFEPTFQKHARMTCGGCQIHVRDWGRFRAVDAATAVLIECRAQDVERFAWRSPPYEYEHEKWPIDILAGTDRFRRAIEAGTPFEEIVAASDEDVRRFRAERADVLLYEE